MLLSFSTWLEKSRTDASSPTASQTEAAPGYAAAEVHDRTPVLLPHEEERPPQPAGRLSEHRPREQARPLEGDPQPDDRRARHRSPRSVGTTHQAGHGCRKGAAAR